VDPLKEFCTRCQEAELGAVKVLLCRTKIRMNRHPQVFCTLSGSEMEKQVDDVHAQGVLVQMFND
jgi:hypothetical protein